MASSSHLEQSNADRSADPAIQLNGLLPFLRIPPFPGARVRYLACAPSHRRVGPELLDLVRRSKVGGSYWAAQPNLPQRYVLVCGEAPVGPAEGPDPVVRWVAASQSVQQLGFIVRGDCDPWHMLAGATMLVTCTVDELCLVAAIMDVPVKLLDSRTGAVRPFVADAGRLLADALAQEFRDPFTGNEIDAEQAIGLCAFWRRLIDSNRDIGGGLGFAFWKQDHVAPLLWDGGGSFKFLRKARDVRSAGAVAVWRTRSPPEEVAWLDERGIPLVEVEDGFLRSRGLGADCVPPLSITVDRRSAYFDAGRPSELELLLQNGQFDGELLDRARQLRRVIVERGLGKYEQSREAPLGRPAGKRRHILVPGQVEDDRSIQCGGGLETNVDLLIRVRSDAPDAYIIYKPHPDVAAGHRRGAIQKAACLLHADEIVTSSSISRLIEMVDEVHVNTSLAGFEALLRAKSVTTHGAPFYAGWGLTRDLGPVPARRSARRSLDELVAAVLLMYPRYLDPVTGLPCPAEIVVDRLSSDTGASSGAVVLMRRLQGRVMRTFRSAVQ